MGLFQLSQPRFLLFPAVTKLSGWVGSPCASPFAFHGSVRDGYQCACACLSCLVCPVAHLNVFPSELLQHTQKWSIIRQTETDAGQAPEVADAFSPSESCCGEAPRIILCRQCKVFFLFYQWLFRGRTYRWFLYRCSIFNVSLCWLFFQGPLYQSNVGSDTRIFH